MVEQMTADDIVKVKNAIIAFNRAKTWDEFLIKLDLIGDMPLDELESKYYEIMSMIDNPVLNKILDNLKGNDSSISLKSIFNRYATEKFYRLAPVRIALPVNIEYENSSLSHDMKVYYDDNMFIGFNLDLCDDIQALHGFDMAAEMASTVMLELAMENSRR